MPKSKEVKQPAAIAPAATAPEMTAPAATAPAAVKQESIPAEVPEITIEELAIPAEVMEIPAEAIPSTTTPSVPSVPLSAGQKLAPVHDPNVLDNTEKRIVGILGNHLGRFNAIRMKKLAEIVGIQERSIRNVINHLKFYHKIPIMSWDDCHQGGYYLPAEGSDTAVCIEMFLSRVWTSLRNVATLKKISMIEAGELVALELEKMSTSEDEAKKKFMTGLPKPPQGYSLITALIKHAQDNPDKYHQDIHVIQNLFGAKFIQRKKLTELAEIQQKLNSIVSEVSEVEN